MVVIEAMVVAEGMVVTEAMVVTEGMVEADPSDLDGMTSVVVTSAPCTDSIVNVTTTDVVDDPANRSPTVSPDGPPQATRRMKRVMGATARKADIVRRRRPTFRRPARPRR